MKAKMRQSVRQLGTSLTLRKGQIVTITPASNLPQGGYFAAPVRGEWGGYSILVKGDEIRPFMDARYTFSRECIGLQKPVWVARFCGDHLTPGTVAYAFTRHAAVMLALEHRIEFCALAGISP